MPVREVTRVAFFEVDEFEPEVAEEACNAMIEHAIKGSEGRMIGLDLERIPTGDRWRYRGVVRFLHTIMEPDPEPDPSKEAEAVELLYSNILNKILALASNVVLMREAGKRGEGMDYGKFWETVDKMGGLFQKMGELTGGTDAATEAPQENGSPGN